MLIKRHPTIPLDLQSPETYAESCLRVADQFLADFETPAEVALSAASLNAYPGLEGLEPPKSVRLLEDLIGLAELGRKSALAGKILWEHPAAGEASRLGLGPKFLLTPKILGQRAAVLGLPGDCQDLLPVTLGLRHLIQPVLELRRLAAESGLDPAETMGRQRVLIITAEDPLKFLGRPALGALFRLMAPGNVWLMGQKAYHGLWRPERGGGWAVDPLSPKRLHNHGQMVMQKTMDDQILSLEEGGPRSLKSREVFSVFEELEDLVSFNIEDLDFLGRALDLESLGLAVRLGGTGYGMVMELAANNPARPIRGGLCAFDPALGRDVMIESFRLEAMAPKDMLYLNKNFNHYPRPARVLGSLRESGLFMPVKVMDDRVHFQPVQGDLNFLARTAFFTRRQPRPLNALKSAADIPAALAAMRGQDAQPGFRELAEEAMGG
jgi:hypothetical protein